MPSSNDILRQLAEVIHERKANPSERSYTSSLLQSGIPGIGAKILEEAQETVEAAGEAGAAGRRHLIHETADLLYHLLVLLGYHDIPLSDVESELARRFGVSGLEEKARRNKKAHPSDDS